MSVCSAFNSVRVNKTTILAREEQPGRHITHYTLLPWERNNTRHTATQFLRCRPQNARTSSNKWSHLEILDSCFLSLEQPLELEVGAHLVEDEHLAVDVLAGGVEEVVQEVADGDVGDVAAEDDKLLLGVNLTIK